MSQGVLRICLPKQRSKFIEKVKPKAIVKNYVYMYMEICFDVP